MELIQHHGPNALQRRIGKQAPGQHPLGDKPQPGARADGFLKPHLVADRLANLLRPSPRPRAAPPIGQQSAVVPVPPLRR